MLSFEVSLVLTTTPDAQMSPPPSQQPAPRPRPWPIFVKGLVWLAATLALLRVAVTLLIPHQNIRPTDVMAVLPTIARAPQPTIFIGSSQMWRGIDPITFDRAAGAPASPSYNLSWDGNSSDSMWLLLQRVREAFGAEGTRPGLLVLEFNPFLSTQTSRRHRWTAGAISALNSPSAVLDTATHEPGEAWAQFIEKYVMGYQQGTMGRVLRSKVFTEEPRYVEPKKWWGPERLTLARDLDAALTRLYPDGPHWEPATRGFRSLDDPQTVTVANAFTNALTTKDFESDLQARISCCDIQKLNLDPYLISRFYDTLRIALTMTPHVRVVVMPINRGYVRYNRESLGPVFQQIEQLTHSAVVDLSESPVVDPADFTDVDHLTNDGARKLSAALPALLSP